MKRQKKLPALVLAAALMMTAVVPTAGAVGTGTLQVSLAVEKPDVSVNGDAQSWDVVPVLVGDQVYVPLRHIANTIGLQLQWNAKTAMVELIIPNVKVQFDIDHNAVWINQLNRPLDTVAMMKDDRLMVKLSWLSELIGAKYTYDAASKKIDLMYTKLPDEMIADENENSRPVAKFTFGKTSYKIGEPVKYIDLSYDPDAEGIARYEWSGKETTFTKAGTYRVSLKVTDRNGHTSRLYSRYLTVTDEVHASPFQTKLYYTPEGQAFDTSWSELYTYMMNLPLLPREVTEDRTRKLILSDSPETIKDKGILYQDRINGKARLYADHVNGMEGKVRFVIMARNTSPDKTVTIKTTNKGEVYPSIYANLIGHEASVDFLLKDPVQDKPITLAPNQGLAYVQMPDLYPAQGINVFYDVETDGEVEFSFLALDSSVSTPTPALLGTLKHLPFAGNVRGTFPVSDMTWKSDMSKVKSPVRITIGDGKEDAFIKGYDTERKSEASNDGNYGMIYNIELQNPPKMAVLLLARGGPFKGPFKLNGEFTMVPDSGVLEAFTRVQVLKRTTGQEGKLNIEFTPPAGSAFPIDLILYPLDDLK
ncbi:stalk domain-containing protein [Gorillibacterium sp. sgz5001074]|uniref:stalk domain-containing protein n=1 Tax=Gorillibacterium sp. sgz5001074 TaxID=3446695 RepID=UPI003F67F068